MLESSANNYESFIALLWAQGDWVALAELAENSAEYSGTAQAYIAIGLLQQGHTVAAKQLLSTIKVDKAVKAKLPALLVSGCKTSLSNAFFINGQREKAEELALAATALTEDKLLQQKIYELRSQLQHKMLYQAGVDFRQLPQTQPDFTVEVLNKIDLGEAWAGNTVNTVIFRHHGVFTHEKQQYTAFYVDQYTLRLAQRCLTTNELKFSDIAGNYNIKDAHNSISLGMDRQGFLHISYDHHGTQLKYRRSLKPYCIESWSEELDMTGHNENKVTYPAFFIPQADEPLQLLYRDGNHQKGSAYLKTYSEDDACWFDSDSAILSGATNQPWTSNAYWNHPVRGSDGSYHLSFIWRTHHIGEQQQINNMNICYAKTYDNGKTWLSSNNKPFKLPITQVNAEVIWPISPASNLINQCSMALDSRNRPHIVFYANETNGIVQYQHLWFDDSKWQHHVISNRTAAFDLTGGGTLRIPISRPEIVIDKDDNVFVIYRGDLTADCMAALCLKAPYYRYEPINQKIIYNENIGLAEPVIDRLRWQREQVLSILLQYNDQPNHDVGHASFTKSINIIDIKFKD